MVLGGLFGGHRVLFREIGLDEGGDEGSDGFAEGGEGLVLGGVREGVFDDVQGEGELEALGEVGVLFEGADGAAVVGGVDAAEDV